MFVILSSTMRLFVAFDLDPEVRQQIQDFVSRVREFAPKVRWVTADSLHVTLKFIGERPESMIKQIEDSLNTIHCVQFQIEFARTGFFPNAKSARVFWIGIHADDSLPHLAEVIDDHLSVLDIAKEARTFSPHLTLARASGGSGAPGWRRGDRPNRQFAELQKFLDNHPAPDFGTMAAREFFLYRSQLSPTGSQYTKIARFELGSSES